MKSVITSSSIFLFFAAISMTNPVQAQSGDMGESLDFAEFHSHKTDKQNLADNAALDPAAARIIALHAFPGAIVSEEIEHEEGGSGLRYSFEIANGAISREVGVDALSGEVLENSLADSSIFNTEGRE